MKLFKKISAVFCAAAISVTCLSGCMQKKAEELYSPRNPVSITVWNYYNGAQLDAFENLVAQFNETRGKELGITVMAYSQGTVNDLQTNVINAASGKVGAEKVPNIFAAYPDTAYEIDRMGLLVDLSNYLTQDQRSRFVEGFLTEGQYSTDSNIRIFPTAKSTELLLLNDTDWQKFSAATGAAYEDLATIEGVVETAQRYYEWTDSLTPEPNDGKAFYGRDAMANYMIIGAMQLGCEIFTPEDGKPVFNLTREVARKLWDNYYVPFVKGYFAASGRFRSDDVKIGNIIACTGSSSGTTFFPKKVTTEEAEYEIDLKVLPAPQFEGSAGYAVEQGAGMAVTKQSEAEIAASLEFLLWFIEPERNIQFSIDSGYMPVTKEACSIDAIHKQAGNLSPEMDAVLTVASQTIQNNTMYAARAFENGAEARALMENTLSEKAAADRAIVAAELAKGKSLEEATALYICDNAFEVWYLTVTSQLNALKK